MWLAVTIIWYTIGLMFLYADRTMNLQAYSEVYFLWDKGKDFLLFITIWKAGNDRRYVKPLVIFTGLRLLWELISIKTGWNISNTKAVGILFMALLLVAGWVTIKDLKKWRNQKY